MKVGRNYYQVSTRFEDNGKSGREKKLEERIERDLTEKFCMAFFKANKFIIYSPFLLLGKLKKTTGRYLILHFPRKVLFSLIIHSLG